MLSRIADSLFWLNRYMERADGLLRVATTQYILALDKDVHGLLTWRPILETFTTMAPEEVATLEHDTEGSLKKLLLDTGNHNSLRVIVNRARENARGVQDHITKEVWEEVNSLYHQANQAGVEGKLATFDAMEVMEQFARHCVLYTGIMDITMPRGIGWSFMNLGKYMERCLETLVLADKQFQQFRYQLRETRDIVQWRHLLLSLSGYELHLKTYRTSNYNVNVLHQVLFNENFPHSLLYCLSRIERHLESVVNENRNAESAALLRHFGRLYSKVRYIDPDSLNSLTLQQFFSDTKLDVLQFGKQLSRHFFSYS